MKLFWDKVDKGPGCWTWTASRDLAGYGQFGFRRRVERAHRVSWILHNGEIPSGQKVLHRCDNPPCVNPAHLFLGTQADNVRDMFAKGRNRTSRGEAVNTAKLTATQVLEILDLKGQADQVTIAAVYGVSRTLISEIHRRKVWKHLTPQPQTDAQAQNGPGRTPNFNSQ